MTASVQRQAMIQCLTQLTAAVSNLGLYGLNHPQVTRRIQAAYRATADVLQQVGSLKLLVIGDQLVVDGKAVRSKGHHLDQFVGILTKKGISHISLTAGVQATDFRQFVEDLASAKTEMTRRWETIRLGRVALKADEASTGQDAQEIPSHAGEAQETAARMQALVAGKLADVKEIYHNINRHNVYDGRGIQDVIAAFVKGFVNNINPLAMLAPLKSADEYTYTHVINVCVLTMSQAQGLGFSGEALHQIGVAATLHDVGKIYMPEEIITKPAALTPDEFKIIQTHTVRGARHIVGLENVPKLAVLGALEHHIRYDGSGYPAMGTNWETHITSQMIAIADMFDAMRSRRPYQDPKPEKLILDIMTREKGTSFNPLLVDNFLHLIRR